MFRSSGMKSSPDDEELPEALRLRTKPFVLKAFCLAFSQSPFALENMGSETGVECGSILFRK